MIIIIIILYPSIHSTYIFINKVFMSRWLRLRIFVPDTIPLNTKLSQISASQLVYMHYMPTLWVFESPLKHSFTLHCPVLLVLREAYFYMWHHQGSLDFWSLIKFGGNQRAGAEKVFISPNNLCVALFQFGQW